MGVAPTSIALEMQFAGTAGAWTNVWADVRAQVDVVASYGIAAGGPGDRCAQPGSLTFALDNSANNSNTAVGYYSPGHANVRSGFEIGIACRLAITYGGTTYYKFVGRLASIHVTANQRGPWTTLCVVHDYLDECLRTSLKRQAVLTSKRGDEVFDTLVAAMPSAPGSSTSGTGRETYALALDAKSPEEGVSVLGELQRLAMSEAGFIYAKGTTNASTAQAFTYESRTDRAKKNTNQSTFDDDDIEAISLRRSRDSVINRMQVLTHPRRKDGSNVVLYSMRDATVGTDSAVALLAGESITLVCPYTDPDDREQRCAGTSMVTPASSTDYTANAAADASGADMSSSLGVSATYGGTSASVVLTNNHASTTLYITKFDFRGLGIYDQQTTVHEQEDATSQSTFGTNAYRYDASYQMDPVVGNSFALHFLGVYKDAQQSAESVTILLNKNAGLMAAGLTREVGDRIGISEAQTALDEGYFIQSVTLTIKPTNIIRCKWTLSPASRIAYWFIGTAGASNVGDSTRIAF
ncbi:MAG: hypothetical protein VX246_13975 [Myxococcota bacterium]|nr:hypothetical protein [Myxococcota bacterium]